MPKVRCPCGFLHNLSPIPDEGWLTIRDRDHDSLTPDESTPPETRLAVWRELIKRSGRLYECPECGRLMWSLPGDACCHFKVYRPEMEADKG